jgi:hypothetical protein
LPRCAKPRASFEESIRRQAAEDIGAVPPQKVDHIRPGWTAGGGVEAIITGNWSAKLEYLYIGLEDHAYYVPTPNNPNLANRAGGVSLLASTTNSVGYSLPESLPSSGISFCVWHMDREPLRIMPVPANGPARKNGAGDSLASQRIVRAF